MHPKPHFFIFGLINSPESKIVFKIVNDIPLLSRLVIKNFHSHTFENRSSPEKFDIDLGADALAFEEEAIVMVVVCAGLPVSMGSALAQPPKSSSLVMIGAEDLLIPKPSLLSPAFPQPKSFDTIDGSWCGLLCVWFGAAGAAEAVSFGVPHALVDPHASILANPEASGIDGFGAFDGTDDVKVLAEEERLNAERLSGAAAVDVIDDAVADAAGKGDSEDILLGAPEKSKRSAFAGSTITLLLALSGPELDDRKSPNPPEGLVDAGFLGGDLGAGGSKKEPPEPKPDLLEPVLLLLLDKAAKFDACFGGA